MLFPTTRFVFFFILCFFLYWYVVRLKKQRCLLLIGASYFFYACWDWQFCIHLFAVSVWAALFGFILGKQKNYSMRKLTLIGSSSVLILFLACFKYLHTLRVFVGAHFLQSIPHLYSCAMPIGISYYTFRALSYIFDIYLCKMRPAGSFAEVLLYISFFPQLASGPIVQAEPFFRTLPESLTRDSNPYTRPIAFDKSLVLIISGTYKKMILANFLLALAVDPVFAHPAQCNTVELLIALLAYTFVIYCDFSGYSDMAIGIALLLGFETPQNFNRPYMVQSVTEFWRRWHISFSSWLRDYVYFAFGGSRFGLIRTAIALIATMLIAGIWHGGRITFLLWGGLQGLACALERIAAAMTQHKNTGPAVSSIAVSKPIRISLFLRMGLVFLFINISWLIFKSASLQELKLYIYSLQNMTMPFNTVHPFAFVLLALAFLLQLPGEAMRKKVFTLYVQLPVIVKISAAALFFIILYTVSMSGTAPFIYFGF